MPTGVRVLIVEDEPEMAELLSRVMQRAYWSADTVSTGVDALRALGQTPYDLAVFDVMLPDIDGIELCRLWRSRGGHTPILLLTVRTGLDERVRGLDAGADDYLGKPFAPEELLARLRALSRRPPVQTAELLCVGDLEVDVAAHAARRAGVWLHLTTREYGLLACLARRPRRVVTRAQILDEVWDDNFDPIANVVEALIARVRRKVDLPGLPPLLHTVRGVGYTLSDRRIHDAG